MSRPFWQATSVRNTRTSTVSLPIWKPLSVRDSCKHVHWSMVDCLISMEKLGPNMHLKSEKRRTNWTLSWVSLILLYRPAWPAHSCSLISIFVIYSLENTISLTCCMCFKRLFWPPLRLKNKNWFSAFSSHQFIRRITQVSLSSTSKWKFYNYYRDKYMILYYFPIAQNTVNKTVRDFFIRDVYTCICMRTNFNIFFYLLVWYQSKPKCKYLVLIWLLPLPW